MTLYKTGEAQTVSSADLRPVETILPEHFDIVERFTKIAEGLKIIAPKANDFLYFSAVMMHAAEAALLDDSGEIVKDADGKPVTATWEKNGDSWKWVCSSLNIKPYKNSNNDIFPEEELVKAHKDWVGKPLCLDHKSNSVDMIRGVIVDTYYDWPRRRVVALCALDKVTYPDLAKKVSSRCTTSVSMGTAVGRAICSDCGKVARTETDFCEHMRNKSCYGEINVDLKPIELSIVVNGADPKARIRHIVASAADTLATYVSEKDKEVAKLAEDGSIDSNTISSIRDCLEEAVSKLKELEESAKEVDEREEDFSEEKPEDLSESDDSEKLYSDKEAFNNNINIKLASISKHLSRLQKDVDKLANSEETNMTMKSKAYHQGGGGDNDPSVLPYKKEDYQTTRDKEDKQMVGQGVDNTGPVDGMHPGYSSFGETEEARKKRLQRLAEERALRRKHAVEAAKEAAQKTAYHQGGGGVNDPSSLPYPKEDYQTTRDKEDKQMVGKKPFPDVGPVDGLYPGDKETKEKLSRAKLTAKFIKSAHPDGNDNPGQSRWQVYADKKLILTATVDEITNGKSALHYDAVATEKFGSKILGLLRTKSFNDVKTILKGAQAVEPPAEEPMAEEPMAEEPMAEEPMAEESVEMTDAGGAGDPKENIQELLNKAENVLADIRAAVDALLEKPSEDLKGFDELAEGMPAEASLVELQKKVGSAITVGMKKAASELTDHVEELRMAKHIFSNSNKISKDKLDYANKLAGEACVETKETLANCYKLMEAFVKYANGTKAIMKRAQDWSDGGYYGVGELDTTPTDEALKRQPKLPDDLELEKLHERAKSLGPGLTESDKGMFDPGFPHMADQYEDELGDFLGESEETEIPKAPSTVPPRPKGNESTMTFDPDYDKKMNMSPTEAPETTALRELGVFDKDDYDYADDENLLDVNNDGTVTGTPKELSDLDKLVSAKGKEPELVVESDAVKPNLETKEGRAAYREKLAQKGLKFSPILQEAHPGGGVTTDLDNKPQGDLGKIETLEETHNKMMDVATAPPRVRQGAEEINRLVVAGRIDPENDFDALVANGLDADAVKYWKQYFAQGDAETSQFASELVKDYQAKKAAEERKSFEVKISRAYELAYDMVRRGMISGERTAVNEQVKEIMSMDDNGFESMKRFVERNPMEKKASMPQVGLYDAGSVTVAPPAIKKDDIKVELEGLWPSGVSKRTAF